MELIFKSKEGHRVLKNTDNLKIEFNGPMQAISTSQLNGGIKDIESCFNHRLNHWVEAEKDFPGGSTLGYLLNIAEGLGLDKRFTTGLITAALIADASVIHEEYKDISIFAATTAGVKINALRAGEPSHYYEESLMEYVPVTGTINVMLVIEGVLPVESLARAVVVVTEAKSAALQDLRIPSCYDHDKIATGTGTDGLVIACNKGTDKRFSDVGGHSKLGELIAETVKKSIYETLAKEGFVKNNFNIL